MSIISTLLLLFKLVANGPAILEGCVTLPSIRACPDRTQESVLGTSF